MTSTMYLNTSLKTARKSDDKTCQEFDLIFTCKSFYLNCAKLVHTCNAVVILLFVMTVSTATAAAAGSS